MKKLKQTFLETYNFPIEVWEEIKPIFSSKKIKKGDYFAKEGEVSTKFGFLSDGVIRGFYRNQEGLEYNKIFFISGTFIGAYTSLLTNKVNFINQQALTDCDILQADFKDFIKLREKHIELEWFSRKIAENHFVVREKREIELVTLKGLDRYKIFKKEFPNLEKIIPQYQIASYLGITPTQLSRIKNSSQ